MSKQTPEEMEQEMQEIREQNERLKKRLYFDSLTGFSSHEALIDDIRFFESKRVPTGIVAADVNSLKVLNEVGKRTGNGYRIGDDTIRICLEALKYSAELHNFDIRINENRFTVYRRLKGDELALLLPNAKDHNSVMEVMNTALAIIYLLSERRDSTLIDADAEIKDYAERKREKLTPFVDSLFSKYAIVTKFPRAPLSMSLGYSYSHDGSNIFYELEKCEAMVAEKKGEFYQKNPKLDPRGDMPTVVDYIIGK